ncbi:structural protein [Providencia rettgeri]|uniref:structural protein n=1 Tax=Providencia rettgeri TaxID=587 RepID=UPI00205A4036|nr:structural protein [Providencia rettgeri]UPS62261.1 structural protein [Providencia rettgeri]
MSKLPPRGIRNNNPGNIRHGDKWRGLHPEQTDKSFCRFIAPEWGYRALFILMRTYERKHKICSIREIINRYAPPVENNTEAYIQRVAKELGVSPDDCLSVMQKDVLFALADAITRVENAGQQPWGIAEFEKGYALI